MLDVALHASQQSSKIGFVESKTNLVTDEDKFRMRCDKSGQNSWIQSKGKNSFGPVNNCINAVTTGIVLSSHMSHIAESAHEMTEINLQSIANQRLSRNISLLRTT